MDIAVPSLIVNNSVGNNTSGINSFNGKEVNKLNNQFGIEDKYKSILNKIRYLDEIEDIAELLIIKNINIDEFLDFIEEDNDAKILIPKIVKASRTIREKASISQQVCNSQNKNVSESTSVNDAISSQTQDNIEKIFDSSVTHE
jgi:hypothetical protein